MKAFKLLLLPLALAFSIQEFLSLKEPSFDSISYNYADDYGLSLSTIDELFLLHKILVSTPSVSYDEVSVGYKLAAYLKTHGLTVDLQKIPHSNRFNLLAYKGSINDTNTLLTSHIDTVPPFFGYDVREDGTKIYGRGSCDDKASVAAQVIAFLDLVDDLEDGEVSLLFDVGEESGGDGMKYVEETVDYKWDTVIFGEPTENKLGIGHKGSFGGVLNVTGLASHSGYPELGINANDILIEFLSKLRERELPYDELLGESTVNVGKIYGGVASNVISPFATATIYFRVAGEVEIFPQIITSVINETSYSERITFSEEGYINGPVFFEYDIEGFDSLVLGYGTDAYSLTKNEIPHKILYGPGSIHVAHGAGEYVTTDDLIQAVDGYKRLIKWSLQK